MTRRHRRENCHERPLTARRDACPPPRDMVRTMHGAARTRVRLSGHVRRHALQGPRRHLPCKARFPSGRSVAEREGPCSTSCERCLPWRWSAAWPLAPTCSTSRATTRASRTTLCLRSTRQTPRTCSRSWWQGRPTPRPPTTSASVPTRPITPSSWTGAPWQTARPLRAPARLRQASSPCGTARQATSRPCGRPQAAWHRTSCSSRRSTSTPTAATTSTSGRRSRTPSPPTSRSSPPTSTRAFWPGRPPAHTAA